MKTNSVFTIDASDDVRKLLRDQNATIRSLTARLAVALHQVSQLNAHIDDLRFLRAAKATPAPVANISELLETLPDPRDKAVAFELHHAGRLAEFRTRKQRRAEFAALTKPTERARYFHQHRTQLV